MLQRIGGLAARTATAQRVDPAHARTQLTHSISWSVTLCVNTHTSCSVMLRYELLNILALVAQGRVLTAAVCMADAVRLGFGSFPSVMAQRFKRMSVCTPTETN